MQIVSLPKYPSAAWVVIPAIIPARRVIVQSDEDRIIAEHTGWVLGMQVIRTGRKAFHHKVQQPRETHPNGTADPTE